MATKTAATGVNTAGKDRQLRRPLEDASSVSLADSDKWSLGAVVAGGEGEGFYSVQYGTVAHALVSVLNGTVTLTAGPTTYSIAGVDTASKLNIYLVSGVLFIQNKLGTTQTVRVRKLI